MPRLKVDAQFRSQLCSCLTKSCKYWKPTFSPSGDSPSVLVVPHRELMASCALRSRAQRRSNVRRRSHLLWSLSRAKRQSQTACWCPRSVGSAEVITGSIAWSSASSRNEPPACHENGLPPKRCWNVEDLWTNTGEVWQDVVLLVEPGNTFLQMQSQQNCRVEFDTLRFLPP